MFLAVILELFSSLIFGPVTTDRQTESEACEPTVQWHRCAQKDLGYQLTAMNMLLRLQNKEMQRDMREERTLHIFNPFLILSYHFRQISHIDF